MSNLPGGVAQTGLGHHRDSSPSWLLGIVVAVVAEEVVEGAAVEVRIGLHALHAWQAVSLAAVTDRNWWQ